METNDLLRKIQLLELEALTELRIFCKKHDMDFFLRGGSVMGAVKYKGFVPWDDDVDIAVPRQYYDKLIELVSKEEWSSKFYLVSYKSDPEIHCYFPRVLVKENVRKELGLPINNKLGLTVIDVLPLDGAPKTDISRNIYFLKTYMYRALAGVWTMDIKETVDMHDSKKKLILKILKRFRINRLYSQVGIYEKLDKLYKKNSLEQSVYIGTITGSLYKKEIMDRKYWGNGVEMNFENQTFLVPELYDDYLKKLYGVNYMTYTPNIDQQNAKKHIK